MEHCVKTFETLPLPAQPTLVAPDGSDVRVLLATGGGSMAHFTLAAGQVAYAVVHRTVDEVWYVLAGAGEMWRLQDDREEVVALAPGLCLTIPVGTRFQFRAAPGQAVSAVAVTMPPWPGEGEAVRVAGPWEPSPP
jgi:mannose-6-phosphate isomerase-like protein (cupin superfamily)